MTTCVDIKSIEELRTIVVGARSSPLSLAQVKEVQREINIHAPKIIFECRLLKTHGDKDQKTSLRTLDKTDFFTKELDEMVLNGNCRIAIHSAKDLPAHLPAGLKIVAITKGLTSDDVLVLRKGMHIDTLPTGSIIATSSIRREEAVKELRQDLAFMDIRGPIQERLLKLNRGVADGIVVAEAALIRLGLTRLNRFKLPGPTTPLQGQLAILSRADDQEMIELFKPLDASLTS